MFDRRRPARYTVGMADRKRCSAQRNPDIPECPRLYRYVYLEKLPRYFKARGVVQLRHSPHRALQDIMPPAGQTQDAAVLAGWLEQH